MPRVLSITVTDQKVFTAHVKLEPTDETLEAQRFTAAALRVAGQNVHPHQVSVQEINRNLDQTTFTAICSCTVVTRRRSITPDGYIPADL